MKAPDRMASSVGLGSTNNNDENIEGYAIN
jgi:hypothetical protein